MKWSWSADLRSTERKESRSPGCVVIHDLEIVVQVVPQPQQEILGHPAVHGLMESNQVVVHRRLELPGQRRAQPVGRLVAVEVAPVAFQLPGVAGMYTLERSRILNCFLVV